MRPQEVELLELEEQELPQHEQVRLLPDCRPQLRPDSCPSPEKLRVEALRELPPDSVRWPEELEDLHERARPPLEPPLEKVHHARPGVQLTACA